MRVTSQRDRILGQWDRTDPRRAPEACRLQAPFKTSGEPGLIGDRSSFDGRSNADQLPSESPDNNATADTDGTSSAGDDACLCGDGSAGVVSGSGWIAL